MTQGWRGVLGTGVIALVMHGIVYATAGLYLAIAIHVAYDLMLGFIAMRQFMQDGAQLALQPQPAPSGG
jgi:membrane protease YdiL (CAAX protease family)